MLDAQKEAQRIFETYGDGQRPVDVTKIAEKLGAKVIFKGLDDSLCGMIYKENDEFIIGVNQNHSWARQRFTIAHEVGHLVMHGSFINKVHLDKTFSEKLHRDGRSRIGEDKIEIDANRFAAELLMPTELLKLDIKDGSIDADEGPTELAALYEVSTQAMSIKLVKVLGDKY